MAVEERIPTILRSYTADAKTVEGRGGTIAELFTDLETRHRGLRDRLVTGEGMLLQFVNVYVNDEDSRFLGAMDVRVHDGDRVTIVPAVAGGACAFTAAAAMHVNYLSSLDLASPGLAGLALS